MNQDPRIEPLVVHVGDCREVLRTLPAESVQCCVTSPPYWGLRDYGHKDQIGLEATPEAFVETMVNVFREVWRVLKFDGTLWINLGDTYAGGGNGGGGSFAKDGIRAAKPGTDKNVPARNGSRGVTVKSKCIERGAGRWGGGDVGRIPGYKPKDLMGIPWRVAFALQADGWWLRSDIVWHKPNPMPESVTDRPTRAHEYIFLLSKSGRYFYDTDAVKEPVSGDPEASRNRWDTKTHRIPGQKPQKRVSRSGNKARKFRGDYGGVQGSRSHQGFGIPWEGVTRNKLSVWTVATAPYPESHFATYPAPLISPCILAGSRPGDVILDPFGGSGTTGQVALELGRRAVLIELNPEYAKLIRKRTDVTPGLAL